MSPPVTSMSSSVNPVTVSAPLKNTRMIRISRTVVALVSAPPLWTACSRVSTSSSVSVSVAVVTFSPVAAPPTVSVLSSSNASSSIAFRMNVPAPERALAGIVTGKSATAWKSVPAVAVTPATATVTSIGVSRVLVWSCSAAVTVTVCAPPSSVTASGATVRITVWSSSSTVTEAVDGEPGA